MKLRHPARRRHEEEVLVSQAMKCQSPTADAGRFGVSLLIKDVESDALAMMQLCVSSSGAHCGLLFTLLCLLGNMTFPLDGFWRDPCGFQCKEGCRRLLERRRLHSR